jgi:hypothetical protein
LKSKRKTAGKLHFIVGFPRSGTKLLRELLNNSVDIEVSRYESNFLIEKKVVSTYESIDDIDGLFRIIRAQTIVLNNPSLIDQLSRVRKRILDNNMLPLDIEEIYQEIFNTGSAHIFLDKSPRYTTKIDELSRKFPASKFIFICRDVRDVVLSSKKTWGKSLYRTADQWHKTVSKVLGSLSMKNGKVILVKYEDLLKNPSGELSRISTFLGLGSMDISEDSIKNTESTESYGDAASAKGILINNTQKYASLSHPVLRRLEEITYTSMLLLDYKITIASKFKPLGTRFRLILKINDELKLLTFHIRDKGIIYGIRYYVKLKNFLPWRR